MSEIRPEKILKLGIKREKGFLYYISNNGGVFRVRMEPAGRVDSKPERVAGAQFTRQAGFVYFVDNEGDISRSRVESDPLG